MLIATTKSSAVPGLTPAGRPDLELLLDRGPGLGRPPAPETGLTVGVDELERHRCCAFA
jgi:hypothetical protein